MVLTKDNRILACRTEWLQNCRTILEAEMRGILMSFEVARELNLQDFVICVDNVEAVWSVVSGSWKGCESFGSLKESLEEFMEQATWSIKHIFRELNVMADAMAKKARIDRWNWRDLKAIPRLLGDIWYMAHGERSSET